MTSSTVLNSAHASRRDDPVKGILLMLMAMAVFTAQDTVSKLLTAEYHAIQVTWGRYLFHTLFMLPLMLGTGGRVRLRAVHPRLQLVRGLGMLASSLLFVLGLEALPIAEASAIGFISPMFVIALSILFLGERVGLKRWAAVVLGFAGVLVVVRPGTAAFNPAALFPVAAAVGWAVALIASRKIRTDDPPLTTLIYTAVSGLAAISLVVPFHWTTPDLRGWLMLAGQGALAALAQYLLIRAFAVANASLLAPFNYSQIVWATLAGYLAFGVLPDRWTWAGAAIIIASGLYIWYRERGQEATS